MRDPRTYTIREMAREFGLTARAIRFYEDKGLIAPSRRGLARIYSHRDRVRLSLVNQGRRVGFSLADIKDLLDLYDLGGPNAQLAAAAQKFRVRLQELEAQKREIEDAISSLSRAINLAESRLAEQEASAVDVIGYGLKSESVSPRT